MEENQFLAVARQGQNSAWRYLLTIFAVVIAALVSTLVLLVPAAFIQGAVNLTTWQIDLEAFSDPVLLVVTMLPFLFILLTLWAGLAILHRRPLVSLINPEGRIRWSRVFFSAAVWFGLSILSEVVTYLINPGNYAWTFDPARLLPFLAIGLVLTPIQTSTEELLFRGYLTQGTGLLTRSYWAAWLIPSVVFGLLHSGNPEIGLYGYGWMMANYIGVGLLLGWITLRSQSLELALGLHAANNLYALLVSFPGSAIRTPSVITLQQIDARLSLLVMVIMSVLYLAIVSRKDRRILAVSSLALVLFLSACVPAAPGSNGKQQQFPLEDCRVSMPGVPVQHVAKCGTLQVAEDPANPSGRQIGIHFAVIPATSQNPEPDPLVLIAGGPGQASTEAFVPLLNSLERINFKRDLVMIDQRGTGQSNPLRCPETKPGEDFVPGQEVPLATQLSELEKCRQSFEADTRLYTTDIAMRDFDAVRAAMGYEQVNLLGVSYGTRAALTYLQLFPERVRTIVLDSVVPLGWSLGEFTARDAQRAMDILDQRCSADPACAAEFPGTAANFRALLDQLEQQPVELNLPDPLTAKPTTLRLTRTGVASTVRMMLYSSETASLLPLLIHKAYVDKDLQPLAAQYLMVNQSLSTAISDGMYLSVLCAEDVPYYSDSQPDADASSFAFSKGGIRSICAAWPHGDYPAGLRTGQTFDVPALLMSGSADPVTPPVNAEQAAAQLPNNRQVVLEGLGHNVFYRGCMPKVLADFLEAGSVQDLALECTQLVQPDSFFISFTGPKP